MNSLCGDMTDVDGNSYDVELDDNGGSRKRKYDKEISIHPVVSSTTGGSNGE